MADELNEIWKVELGIFREFLRVCGKHNLDYMMFGGSLLGTMRHRGFIPWDDDIDVIMPRADYDRLMEVGPEEFAEPYFFQNPITEDGRYFCTHCQIRDSRTTALIAEDAVREINRGIFIDIFVLDRLPAWLERPHYLMWEVIKKYLTVFNIRRDRWFREWNRHERMYRHFGHAAYVQAIDYNRRRLYADPSVWEGRETAMFCGIPVQVPARYDSLLTTWYGAWREPKDRGTVHGKVIFRTDMSYTDYLKQG